MCNQYRFEFGTHTDTHNDQVKKANQWIINRATDRNIKWIRCHLKRCVYSVKYICDSNLKFLTFAACHRFDVTDVVDDDDDRRRHCRCAFQYTPALLIWQCEHGAMCMYANVYQLVQDDLCAVLEVSGSKKENFK